MIVAIDGPAGSGKSTAARNLADKLRLTYINTGAMYRAVALLALDGAIDLRDEIRVADVASALDIRFERDGKGPRCIVQGRDRTDELFTVALTKQLAPVVNSKKIRAILVEKMRRLARGGDVVMEGRDIGTVVFPDADCKFFLVADLAERARRRAGELTARGEIVDLKGLERQIADRDRVDESRDIGPLAKAADAIVVDTTGLTADQTLHRLLDLVRRKTGTL